MELFDIRYDNTNFGTCNGNSYIYFFVWNFKQRKLPIIFSIYTRNGLQELKTKDTIFLSHGESVSYRINGDTLVIEGRSGRVLKLREFLAE